MYRKSIWRNIFKTFAELCQCRSWEFYFCRIDRERQRKRGREETLLTCYSVYWRSFSIFILVKCSLLFIHWHFISNGFFFHSSHGDCVIYLAKHAVMTWRENRIIYYWNSYKHIVGCWRSQLQYVHEHMFSFSWTFNSFFFLFYLKCTYYIPPII